MIPIEFLEADLSDYINLKLTINSIQTYTGGTIHLAMSERYPEIVIKNPYGLPSKYKLNGEIRGVLKYDDGRFEFVTKKPTEYYLKQIARIEGSVLYKVKVKSERCTVKALYAMPDNVSDYINIANAEYEYGVPPVVSFTIQSDPISEVGVNGCQVSDMLEYVKNLFVAADEAFPCDENKQTILKLKEAIHWQDARTKDRIRRNVEGKNAI